VFHTDYKTAVGLI